MTLKSRILNRGFSAWVILAFGVLNLMIGIRNFSSLHLSYLSCFNFFMAGACFMVWLDESLINTSLGLGREALNLCSKIMKRNEEFMDKVSNITKKQKGGEKK